MEKGILHLEGRPQVDKPKEVVIDKRNKMLVIVDAQHDFVRGSLAVNGAVEAMTKLREYLNEHKGEYKYIIFTLDWHPLNHISFKSWPQHCVQYTRGAMLCEELIDLMTDETINQKILVKGDNASSEEYSIFQNYFGKRDMNRYITDATITDVDVCGIAGDFCVLNTVSDMIGLAKNFNKKINILTPFIAYVNDDKKLMALCDENQEIIRKIE